MFKYVSLLCCLLLFACHQEDKNTLKVGVIAGPESQLMEVAATVANTRYHLPVKIVEFTDYVEPNAALNDGSIQANMFQHQPFLDQQIKDRHYSLIAVGKTFVYPMGVYSHQYKNLMGVPAKSLVAIPNDPSNEGRALLLLQKAGLIKLKNPTNLFSTPVDVIENSKQLNFKELDAAQLTRSLADVALAVINTNYAIPAGLTPTKDAIFLEGSDSAYANIIVIRLDEKNDPRISQLVSSIQSNEVRQKAAEIFKNQAIPAWKASH